MNITGMLYGAPLLKHVDFPTSEVLHCIHDRDYRMDYLVLCKAAPPNVTARAALQSRCTARTPPPFR